MFSVVTHGGFGVVIADDPKQYGYDIVNFTSNPYTIKEGVIIDGIIIKMGEQAVNSCYPCHLIQVLKFYE